MKSELLCIGLGCCFLPPYAYASIPVDQAPFIYNQNFDSLPSNAGTASVDSPWVNNSTLPGWSIYAGETQAADISQLRVGNGSSGSDRSHMSYGTPGSTERAFGYQSGSEHRHSPSHGASSISDSTPSSLVQANSQVFGSIVTAFLNNSGSLLNVVDFSYTGEQWRASATRANTIFVQWAVGRPDSKPGDLTWNDITSEQAKAAGANFVSPITTSAGALDGNAPANRVENLGAVLRDVVWNPGDVFFVRWVDVNDPSSDHGLAVDDFVLNASFEKVTPDNFRGAYLENFNSLGTTGTTPPAGWSVFNGASGSDKYSWQTSIAATGVAAMVKRSDTLVVATPPTSNSNRGYNAGLAATASDRMLSSSPTGDAGTAFQLELTNASDEQINAISVSYDIRRFTAPTGADELPGYQLFFSLDNGSTWSNVEALNPKASGNGILVPNTVGLTQVPATTVPLGSIWAPGAKLLLRWVDDNGVASSPDQILGLDNVSVSKADIPYTGPAVPAGSVWSYLDTGVNPGQGWNGLAFDDSSWKSGGAELGYGDGNEKTVIGFGPSSSTKYPAYFFRHAFDVTDVDSYKNLLVRLKRDDGAVVYLNGVEILRDNMPAGEITHETYTTGNTVDGANESTFFEFTLPTTGLVNGKNVIAVSVHQDRPSSSDVSFDLELSLIEKPNPNAPVFDNDILTLNGGVINGSYDGSLADLVTDPNGDPLVFTKIDGPAWLVIGEDGKLSGTPGAGDIGTNEFVVSVTDNKDGTVTAVIRIEVTELPELARAPFPGSEQSLTFGIVPDTQGSTNGVPTVETRTVAERMIAHNPKFAIHVGDVTDGNHSGDSKMVELNYFNSLMTTPLANAGIPLYPVRGNHDANVHSLTSTGRPVWRDAFPHLFTGPNAVVDATDVPNGSPASPNGNNYSFVLDAGNNTYFIGLDMWQGGNAANYSAWASSKMEEIRAKSPDAHIFGYSHSGLFSSSNHPAMTQYVTSGPGDFIAAGKVHKIDGWFSGHNHIFDRSIAVDSANDNLPAFFNMTVGSASNKFYTLSRSPVAGQHINKIIDSTKIAGTPLAYQVTNINGPFVTIRTWMSPKNSSGGFTNWTVWDEYTYSTNGQQFTVASGADYNSRNIRHTSPISGTSVQIMDGRNSDTTTYTYGANTISPYRNISIGWWNREAWYESSDAEIVSDIVSLHGMRDTPGRQRTEPYTLVIKHDGISNDANPERFSLVSFLDEDTTDTNPGEWMPAVSATLGTVSTTPFFRAPAADEPVGNWGIDTTTGQIWARLDYQGDFAVAAESSEQPEIPGEITDHKTYENLTIPAGTKVTVKENGSLEVTGGFQLEQGAELVVEGGSIKFPDGSVVSGKFTVFNSFGSWNVAGNTTFEISQSLALVSDIHVAPGATIRVRGGGELILDGCVIDSSAPAAPAGYNIVVEETGLLTIARSVVSDASIDINTSTAQVPENLRSRIYDSSFVRSDIEASSSSAVYHNLFDAATAAETNTESTTAFAPVDGWANVTDAADLRNRFSLEFDAPVDSSRTLDSDGNLFVQPGDDVSLQIKVSDLGGNSITAAEALVGYNSGLLGVKSPASPNDAVEAAPGWQVIVNDGALEGSFGFADTALGLQVTTGGADGSNADATIAGVLFEALNPGTSAGFFRVQTKREFDDLGNHLKDTRLVRSEGGLASYLAPFTSNTGQLVVDNQNPEIDVVSVTGVQQQAPAGNVNVLDTANARVFRASQPVVLTFTARDLGAAGLDTTDLSDDLVVSVSNGTTTLGANDYTATATENQGVVTYVVNLTVPATASSGTYTITGSVIDRSGNSSGLATLGQFVTAPETLATVELEGFGDGSREVTFVATGGETKTWVKTVAFTAGVGSASLDGVPVGTTAISAKTAWSLRKKAAVTFSQEGDGSALFTGLDKLKSGDLNGDNVINTLDYSMLRNHWFTANPVADLNGDGAVNNRDYLIMQENFYQVGDPR